MGPRPKAKLLIRVNQNPNKKSAHSALIKRIS